MSVSMDNFFLTMIEKTLAKYSLSGHPIKLCKVKW